LLRRVGKDSQQTQRQYKYFDAFDHHEFEHIAEDMSGEHGEYGHMYTGSAEERKVAMSRDMAAYMGLETQGLLPDAKRKMFDRAYDESFMKTAVIEKMMGETLGKEGLGGVQLLGNARASWWNDHSTAVSSLQRKLSHNPSDVAAQEQLKKLKKFHENMVVDFANRGVDPTKLGMKDGVDGAAGMSKANYTYSQLMERRAGRDEVEIDGTRRLLGESEVQEMLRRGASGAMHKDGVDAFIDFNNQDFIPPTVGHP
jgi:hypothetical protein